MSGLFLPVRSRRVIPGGRLVAAGSMPSRNGALACALLSGAVALGGCAPAPPPTSSASAASGSPSGAITAPPTLPKSSATVRPSPTAAALSRPSIRASFALPGVRSMTGATGGAWFVTQEPTGGSIGFLTADGVARRAPAGPAPVAIAASGSAVFVVEGVPEGSAAGQARVGRLERIDAATLRVLADTRLADPADAVVHTPGLVWIVGAGGSVSAYDDQTLAEKQSFPLGGRPPGSLAASPSAIWVVVGAEGDNGAGEYILARISLSADHALTMSALPGVGIDPLLTAGTEIWLAVAEHPGDYRLFLVDDGGKLTELGPISAPAAIAVGDGLLWSVGVDGSAEVVEASTGARSPSFKPAEGAGSAIAADGRTAFVASSGRVFVMTAPAN